MDLKETAAAVCLSTVAVKYLLLIHCMKLKRSCLCNNSELAIVEHFVHRLTMYLSLVKHLI